MLYRQLLFASLSAILMPLAAIADEPKPEFDPAHAEKMQEGLSLFKSQVRQVLIDNCVDCHGGDGGGIGLRPGDAQGAACAAVRTGRRSSPASRPTATSSASSATKKSRYMPDGGDKLPDEQIAAIASWIDLGAPYDKPLVANPRDPDSWTATVVADKAREFWSFQPLAKHRAAGGEERSVGARRRSIGSSWPSWKRKA